MPSLAIFEPRTSRTDEDVDLVVLAVRGRDASLVNGHNGGLGERNVWLHYCIGYFSFYVSALSN